MIEEARKQGPVLVLDAGNALFRAPGMTDPMSLKRADFILAAMGKVGTFAMAVGARDLGAGPVALKAGAEKAKVKLLSANLAGSDGKLLFAPSATVGVGAVKVGLIGVSPAGLELSVPGVKGLPVVAAVGSEAKALKGKVDLVVVLAAVPYADALQLATELKDRVDVVLNSHDSRGAGPAQRVESSYVVPGGERGRQLGRLELDLAGKGPFVDVEEGLREAQLVPMIRSQVAELKKRLDATRDAQVKKDLGASIASLEASQRQHEKAASAAKPNGARTLKLVWAGLGPDVKDDPALKAEVDKLETPEAAEH